VKAWVVHEPAPFSAGVTPLVAVDRAVPEPGPGEIRLRVAVCGVCRTDLHLAEGDLRPRRADTVPGHEVVGYIDGLGPGAHRFEGGERVGIAWLRGTCGHCRWCTTGRENLCPEAQFTGWDADGGYAEYAVVDEHYAYPIPDSFEDDEAAPLLCAGIIGYRALRLSNLPKNGRLGIYGFGGSAHIAAQIALWQGATVHVMTRSADAQRLALELGAASAQGAYDQPPEPLDGAILFAPVGELVPIALQALDRGGTLAVAGIHLSAVPVLDYKQHLFDERTLRSVTANTRADGEEFLLAAALAGVRVTTVRYPFKAADVALADLAADRITGAAVLEVEEGAAAFGP
jgi:propanol-preferring alcohol dehydrogenase